MFKECKSQLSVDELFILIEKYCERRSNINKKLYDENKDLQNIFNVNYQPTSRYYKAIHLYNSLIVSTESLDVVFEKLKQICDAIVLFNGKLRNIVDEKMRDSLKLITTIHSNQLLFKIFNNIVNTNSVRILFDSIVYENKTFADNDLKIKLIELSNPVLDCINETIDFYYKCNKKKEEIKQKHRVLGINLGYLRIGDEIVRL